MLRNYLKIAYRNLLRHKGYTAINVAGLAVGLAGSFFILLWVQDELSYNRFLEDGDRIHRVWRNDLAGEEVETQGGTSKPLAETMEAEYPEIEEAVQTTWPQRFMVTQGDERFREPGLYANADFLDVFRFPFIAGDPETALQGKSAVITDRLARKLLAKTGRRRARRLGQPINVDRWEGIAVTGVIADVPENSSLQFAVLLPIQGFFARNPRAEEWGVNYLPLYVKLSEGASLADVNAKVADVVNRHEEGANEVVFLQPYEDLYLYSEYENGQLVGGRIEYVRIFSVVAVFLLLIAAINFMNLATARSMERAREVGVRKAVGARQGSLVGQVSGRVGGAGAARLWVRFGARLRLAPALRQSDRQGRCCRGSGRGLPSRRARRRPRGGAAGGQLSGPVSFLLRSPRRTARHRSAALGCGPTAEGARRLPVRSLNAAHRGDRRGVRAGRVHP